MGNNMESRYQEIVKELYHLIEYYYPSRFNHTTHRKYLPESGIYLFFEKDETLTIDNRVHERIVRVGTHLKDGNFPGRIRQHYGNKHSLKGNKNGSVFRKHVGGAIIRKELPGDPRLSNWLKQMGPSYVDIEEKVSRTLRDNFTFVCFPVATRDERLSLESALISLLAQYPLGKPSPTWLGLWADSPIIRSTGLWNTNETDKKPLNEAQLSTIKAYMEEFTKDSGIGRLS
jgi:hypothetical protein